MLFKSKPKEHKVTMYVEMKALAVSETVQRNVPLEDILLKHTRFYDDKDVALKDGYIPLNFATTIRTVFSNKVIGTVKRGRNYPIFCTNLGDVEMFPHKGLDLVMYLTSVAMFNVVEYKKGFDDLMLHSEFQSIGIYNPDPSIINPIIYSHVYIDDSWEKDFETYLKETSKWYDIEYAKNAGDNLKALLDTLIIAQNEGGKDNE